MTHLVRAIRSGSWWAIEFPDAPGVHSQARRLDQVEEMARDALALFHGVNPDQIDLKVEADLPPEWVSLVNEVRRAQAAADQATAAASRLLREAASALQSAGLPVRDIGTIMDHRSPQRISQLLNSLTSGRASGPVPRAASAGWA
jgi:predicted RNase H-like HicB family nuclease